ncbi:SRA stem-loop-interacting RNA-binding protein, mitochondrial [Cynoglossus semilaevis]|uniref:SRA stem-loop interacting RNA binding protein n=1 Tax=Cynoglossus semilaevis TaxID=244447 RepID=A0A3P8WGH1_CYNSE|nr:SRA stem-loop-interacting RNA-binding protein, mitochondrial [Cynoglossus semilaevis]
MAASARKVTAMFVSKIPWTVSSKELREHFGKFGKVRMCRLPFDKETGFHKGFCWIQFNKEEELVKTLQEKHMLEGRKINVQRNIGNSFETEKGNYHD